ncbi:MAG: hypothetical protein ACI4VK_04615 [Candidatus Coproplasma sp.]
MKVNEVVCQALRLVGENAVADSIISGETLSAEYTRIKNTFLTYFNSVIDELARGYFPLPCEEAVSLANGKKLISSFSRRVVRINKVLVADKAIDWHISAGYLYADADNVTVRYEYAMEPFEGTEEFFYPDYAVGERLVCYGMAAEHFLVSGCAEESRAWEQKYRDEIEALVARCTVKPRIPPRRWI